jgi:hypothetical protein
MKLPECQTKASYHLVTGCQQKHIDINTPCTACLTTVTFWHKEKKVYCGHCDQLILSGQYQLINDLNYPLIKTYNLAGNIIRETPNPNHIPYTYLREVKTCTTTK